MARGSKPGDAANRGNYDGRGVISVTIRGGADFDMPPIHVESLRLAGLMVKATGPGEAPAASMEHTSSASFEQTLAL